MKPKTELLHTLSIALSQGQGGFTEEDLALAFAEIYDLLMRGQLGMLVLDGKLALSIENGTVLYSQAGKDGESSEPLPLEMLIENMRDPENT